MIGQLPDLGLAVLQGNVNFVIPGFDPEFNQTNNGLLCSD
jgi:hypothetical protein